MAGAFPSPTVPQRGTRFLDLVDFPVQTTAGPLSPPPLRPGKPRSGLHPHPDSGDQRARSAAACADGRLDRSDLEARLPGVALSRVATPEAGPGAGTAYLRAERFSHLLFRLGGGLGDRRLRHPGLQGQGGAQWGDPATAADRIATRQRALAQRTRRGQRSRHWKRAISALRQPWRERARRQWPRWGKWSWQSQHSAPARRGTPETRVHR